jgi:geranylgeranyl diphosphate synthase, type II
MPEIDDYLLEKKKLIDQALLECLPPAGASKVGDAMRYSIAAGGKRLRPILCLAAASVLGSPEMEILDVACSLELVHTYSLIHDDLPAMDDSDLRRGIASCHVAFGEAIAVLAGDGLLTLAFEKVARYGIKNNRAEQAALIAIEIAQAAGLNGMIGGQELDLTAEGKTLSLPEIERIAALKTGALITASIMSGAIAAGAGKHELATLNSFAASIGKAFQIVDDLLDQKGTAAELGKPVDADQQRAKATLPALIGAEAAQDRADLLYQEALSKLDTINSDTGLLSELAYRLVYRNK